MTYTVNGVTQTKPITRFIFGAATCTLGGAAGSSPNYSDLWYRSEAESGWGVNIVHQGDILFATWFTYEAGGTAAAPAKGMWLVMSGGTKTSDGVYTGVLQRTTGPNAFSNTTPFNGNLVVRTTVGDATFTFTGPVAIPGVTIILGDQVNELTVAVILGNRVGTTRVDAAGNFAVVELKT